MDLRFFPVVFLFCALSVGCASRTLPELIENKSHVTYQNTSRIVIRGTEADIGAGNDITIDEQYLIQEVWDAIYQSRPYDRWSASGYRVLEFYNDPDAPPSIVLYVNETGATHTSLNDRRFRCPGLHELIAELQHEHRSKPKPAEAVLHTVSAGETLAGISKQYYGAADNWRLIMDANRDTLSNPGQLRVGMKLRIPALPAEDAR